MLDDVRRLLHSSIAVVTVLVALAAGCSASLETPRRDLLSLVEAERAFALTSVERGMRAAFLHYLAEGAVLFRPGPVDGRAWIRDQPEGDFTLAWGPRRAEVSGAGDLGYTTGPWELRGSRSSRGQYLSVWRREPSGSPWRVILDVGTFELPADGPAASRPASLGGWSPEPREPERWRSPEHPFDDRSAPQLDHEVQRRHLRALESDRSTPLPFAADIVLLRNGGPPSEGVAEVEAARAEEAGLRWRLDRVEVAASADLAVTLGSYSGSFDAGSSLEGGSHRRVPAEVAAPTLGHWVWVWRRLPGGEWRVTVELLAPLPTRSPG